MTLPEGRKPLNDIDLLKLTPISDQPQYVIVTTVAMFKHKYAIPVSDCHTPDPRIGAMDEVTMQSVREMGQEWLGETIVDTHVVTLSAAIEQFDALSPYLSSWSVAKKTEYLNSWEEAQDV
jgi:hypothetical protein